jgi:hypothetical protein
MAQLLNGVGVHWIIYLRGQRQAMHPSVATDSNLTSYGEHND